MSRPVPHARWVAHANGVNPSPAMRNWLTDRISLTIKLIAKSNRFRVQRLRQARGMSLHDEFAMLGMARPGCVQEREVLLRCDERPVVYAHTIVPLNATASDWPSGMARTATLTRFAAKACSQAVSAGSSGIPAAPAAAPTATQ